MLKWVAENNILSRIFKMCLSGVKTFFKEFEQSLLR